MAPSNQALFSPKANETPRQYLARLASELRARRETGASPTAQVAA